MKKIIHSDDRAMEYIAIVVLSIITFRKSPKIEGIRTKLQE